MHPNPVYRDDDQARALMAARERGFGVITVPGPEGVLASHAPFSLDATTVDLHLSRGGALARHMRGGPVEALLIVSGPDAYVTPEWYGIEDQFPTWNYVAVHLRGELRLLPDEELRPLLERLTAEHEARLPGKRPWTMDEVGPEIVERMMRQIVPLRMAIASVEATYKLGQKQPDSVRLAAARAVAESSYGHETATLARLMREPKQH